jgi:serine/threonine-protein kinase
MDLPVSIGEIVANKYRIDRVIGTGGMGVVVAAFHLELEQPVAIKFLNGEAGSRADASERFRREARAAARIHSEHVARVLDIELLHNHIPYMVMELLEGHDLEQELQQQGRLPVAVAVDYVLQAIDAIAEAHASGVVHRDLKPTNLFLARRSDGSRIIKVLDFGISKLVGPGWGPDAALTRSASIFGSPLYMSPEQMRSSKDVDARADVWSLGAILYELIAGQPPYVADSMPALCVAIMTDPPRRISELVPGAPPLLEAVLYKCLAREAAERYESVADLAEALESFAPGGHLYSQRARRRLSSLTPGFASSTARFAFEPVSQLPRGSTPAAPDVRLFPAKPGRTQSSWGKTGGRMVNRKIGTILGALAIFGILAVGGWLFARQLSSKGSTVERVQAALPASAPPSAGVAAEAPSPVSQASASQPVPAAPPVSSAVAAAPSVPVATSEPEQATAATDKTAKVAKPPRSSAAPPRRSATSRDKPASGSSAPLSDFGGRLY